MLATDNQTEQALQWEPAPARFWLGEDEVHVWRARLDVLLPMPTLRETLTAREAVISDRLADPAARREFVASRGLLRTLLAGYLSLRAEDVPLQEHRPGRFRLAPPHDHIGFDFSAADGLLLIAFIQAGEVGLDLQRIRENLPITDLASHYFEPEETWEILIARGHERASRFFEIWARNEALRRAGESALTVNHFSPANGFTAAIAVPAVRFRLACWDWRAPS